MAREITIIVGAPRSGTNMLRDVLTSLDGHATWPCDEINLLWRHGNRNHPDDELGVEQARPEVRAYLRNAFDRLGQRYGADVVVEKTCATSLRVDFARAVFPEAKFLFITRDGVDAAASAMQRWNAPLDVRYTARKVRYVPPADVPFYAGRFASGVLKRRKARTEQSGQLGSWWGPKPHDFRELMATRPLDEVCLMQWQRCVESSLTSFATMPEDQWLHLAYEDYVAAPGDHTRRVLDFLGRPHAGVDEAVRSVSDRSVGKGRSSLSDEAVARLDALAAATTGAVRGI